MAGGEGRIRERVRRLERRERECEREIDASYRRLEEWQRLKIRGWERRSGQDFFEHVASGTANSAMVGRQIKKERRFLKEAYADLYRIEYEIEEALEEIEERQARESEERERSEEERRGLEEEVVQLRDSLDKLSERVLTDRAKVQELYAEIGTLEEDLEEERAGRQREARDDREVQTLHRMIAEARAELEEYRTSKERDDRGDERDRTTEESPGKGAADFGMSPKDLPDDPDRDLGHADPWGRDGEDPDRDPELGRD